ncbi:DUF1462 family protein [Pullulanibacillus sp. KACC 23026]|uniref:YuzD family protein n=1 Tax=Pullulanibacillus sp. KACC 23026 TaxID=3028315 RepID=UPI0023AE82DE|nr:DUF1462 family protein [Pullulanibacillus sp. KACC 23026]WEG13780.1 DUF1462 family protein [Pullulanibacillus sp. KACC 23026]
MKLTVYGADTPCPSCLHSPSSKETKEWLEAALKRKFPDSAITLRYVDLDEPETDEDVRFTNKIKNDEYFYPLVVSEGQVLGEGDPRLKTIVQYLEEKGLQSCQL